MKKILNLIPQSLFALTILIFLGCGDTATEPENQSTEAPSEDKKSVELTSEPAANPSTAGSATTPQPISSPVASGADLASRAPATAEKPVTPPAASGNSAPKLPPLPTGMPGAQQLQDLKAKADSAIQETVDKAKAVYQQFNVDSKKAAELLAENPELVILDLRTPGEFERGMIPSAINIDFRDPNFLTNLKKLSTDKDYLIHCQSGGRSTQALTAFQSLGFGNIYHLDGGFSGWEKAGLQTAKP